MDAREYLSEPVCYGGEWMPRGEVYAELRRVAAEIGAPNPQAYADRWMHGYDSRNPIVTAATSVGWHP